MNSFSVKILDPTIKTLEIETAVGSEASKLDIITYNNNNIVIENSPILLPADYINSIDTEIISYLDAGSGINLSTTNSGLTVSVSGLNHNYITDFDSSVSGLLPITNIVSGTNINISKFGSVYTVSATGLQPSGNYSLVGHSHSTSDITNFNSSVSGLFPITSLSGVSGVLVTNNGTSYIVSLNDPSIQLSDITDLTNNAKTFLITPSSNNLLTLISDETGSGVLVFNDSPAFTGIPLVPTASSGTNTQQIASTAFVRTEISNLINSAPNTLDTLNELATALGNDPNFATTVTNNLAGKANLSGATFTGSISGPSGNFVSLKVNNVDVSVSGHSHTSSEITDFNSSVSGLLAVKNISAGEYISVSSTTGNYTIFATGLQPSGNYSTVGHTHTSSNITDFNSSVSGLLPVKDIVAGSGISIGSVSGTYTVTAFGVAASSASSLITEVYNNTASTIPKGSVVYIDGGHGNLPTISLAIANGESGSSKTYGITATNISSNNNGNVVVIGSLIDFDTNQFGVVEGTTLYLSPSTSGAMTTTKPLAPNHLVSVGKIVRNANTQGVIQVNIQNGFELGELHNVSTNGTSDGQFLRYNLGSGLWIPSSSGNFTILTVNNTGVSVSGHTHSSSDITNFNSSVSGLLAPYQLALTNPVTGTGIANHIAYWNSSSGIIADSGQLYWDATNNRLGIGTSSPSSQLHVVGSGIISSGLSISNQTASTLASFDSNKNIVSLDTATYPSLTELSYVKGLTSAVQTQIDGKTTTSRTLTAGSGLVGGGTLSADRIFDIGQGDGISVSADSIAVNSTVVRTTGTQTIDGEKTFNAGVLRLDTDGAIGGTINFYASETNSTTSSVTFETDDENLYVAYKNVGGLAQFGYENVTNDTQVKKIASSTSGNIPFWNGTTGDLLANGYGVETVLSGNSSNLPRADAVKTYVDNMIASGIATNDAMLFKGVIDCSTNPNYPAADRGWTYKVSVAGKIGGASGPTVEVNDTLICTTDGTSAGTHASVGGNWVILQTNIADASILVTGTGIANHIAYWNSSSGIVADSGQLYWDSANDRLGIGTSSPSATLHVVGNTNIDGNLTFDSFTESVISNGNSSSGVVLSLTSGTVQTCTLTNNCTFTMPTATAGKSFTMFLNTGSGNYTASFSGVRWADSANPTATILTNKVDIFSFISDGSYWYGSFSQNYG